MKNSKSVIATMVLATASFATSVAYAQDVSSPPEPLGLVGTSGFFGNAFAPSNEGASFMDQYTFSVTDVPHDLDAIVASASRMAEVGLDIDSFSLYDGAGSLITNGTSTSTGARDVWSLSADSLALGDYYVQVSGTLLSATSGSYGGSAMLNPVPEPETYAMMLAGLGILGFLARRRKAGKLD